MMDDAAGNNIPKALSDSSHNMLTAACLEASLGLPTALAHLAAHGRSQSPNAMSRPAYSSRKPPTLLKKCFLLSSIRNFPLRYLIGCMHLPCIVSSSHCQLDLLGEGRRNSIGMHEIP